MRIRFTKGRGRPHTLTCLRNEGSSTWSSLGSMPVQHDLTHFAVETTLGLCDSFFGLVARGYAIEDLTVPKERRTIGISEEARQTENLVSLLQAEFADGAPNPDFPSTFTTACQNANLTSPKQPTHDELEAIRLKVETLMTAWRNVEPGETMELEFRDEDVVANA